MHESLRRQLDELGLDADGPWTAEQVVAFLAKVDEAYANAVADREVMARSLEASSREMADLYADLKVRSSDALHSERDKLKAVLATLHDGIAAFGPGGTVFANKALKRLLGLRGGTLEVRSGLDRLDRRVALDDGSSLEARIAAARTNATPWSGTGAIGRRRVPVAVNVLPSLAQGDEGLILVSLRDISLEREAQSQLRLALAAAREAIDARERFLAVMSHEIRTPMNGVIGASGLLLTTKLDERQADYARTIRKSGEVLLALINDVLDFSKLDADRLELERAPFDPALVLESVVDLVARSAFEAGLDLGVFGTEMLPERLHGDSGRVRQIILNLLTNAVKFTPRGSIRIETQMRDDAWLIDVVDTGIGIPADTIDVLFEPFRQADASTTRRFGGTGLGLAICHRLCKAMGGSISAISTPGTGTCFRVSLPLPVVEPPGDRSPFGREECVWIVAPPSFASESLDRMVRSWRVHVWSTATPNDAVARLDVASARAPTVVVIDAQTDAERLVSLLDARDVPVVVLRAPTGDLPPWVREGPVRVRLARPPRRHQVHDALAAALGYTRPPPSQPRDTRTTLDSLRVLVAEDNPVNQMVARRMLEHLGCACEVVSDGSEAVDAVRGGDFDVVLMDLRMPVLDGLEATLEIRAGDFVQPRIIAMTANVMAEDVARCRAAGMDGYLSKPVTMSALSSALTAPSAWRDEG